MLVVMAGAGQAWAIEERYTDLSASVEVAPVFGLTLDTGMLSFRQAMPGRPIVLGESHHFNEVRCRANSGRPWYVKAQLVELRHVLGNESLAPWLLKVRVAEAKGEGQVMLGRQEFESLSDQPVLIYTGAGSDNRGAEVILRFQYRLEVPETAQAGDYVGQITFTMVETP